MRSDTAVTEKQVEMEPNLVTVDQTPAADQNNFNNIEESGIVDLR